MRNAFLNIFRGCLILSMVVPALTVQADEWSEERYPWDERPIICSLKKNAGSGLCQARNWLTYEDTKKRLRSLFQTGRFSLLERAFTDLAASDELFPDGTNSAGVLYSTLIEILNTDHIAKEDESPIAQWKLAVPNSNFRLLADALKLRRMAWGVHGYGRTAPRLKESRELFALKLDQAEQMLRSVPPALKDTAVWHLVLLKVTLDIPGSKPQVVFEDAVKRWPRHIDFYSLIVSSLTPEWGGSWEMVGAFIDHASRQLEATEGASFYARLYVDLDDEVLKGQTAMNWNKMKMGFEDWIVRYPYSSLHTKNLYASYACFARDKSAFGRALGQLSNEDLVPKMWLAGHSYEACVRWAGI